jgi:flagellar P-ring protein precursor FlgI
MRNINLTMLVILGGLGLAAPASAAPVRVKELVDVQGVRDNSIFGYGLVVGLAGTGDTQMVLFTSQSISGMLGRLGIRIDPKEVIVRNVAAVMVTARLPSYARPGTHLDVNVGSMGDARSLAGGVLLVTPLTGPDGQVYAIAQGPVQAGGFDIGSSGSRMQKNQPTSGTVPSGASIERAVVANLSKGSVMLGLRRPDFTTALRIADAINKSLGGDSAHATDPASIEVKPSDEWKDKVVGLLAKIEALEVDPDQRARIVVSERTGTIVAGEGVRIRPVAVAHGGLSISVTQTPFVSQPNPASRGQTVTGRTANIEAREGPGRAVALPATTSVEDLVKALNMIGVGPRDLVAVLQAMKAAGAIDADLEVM